MADEKQKDAGQKDSDRKPKGDAAPAEDAYTRAEHIQFASAMYDVPGHVVAGAFAVIDEKRDGDATPKDQYTKSEVRTAIAGFSSRRVTEEN